MTDTRLSVKERSILKEIVGGTVVSFKSTQRDNWNQIYGNFVIKTRDAEYEVRNEVEPVGFFDGIEDVSVFHIAKISTEHPYMPMVLDVPIVETLVNKTVDNIRIIEDNIQITNSSGDVLYRTVFDTAIVFIIDNESYVFSREWYFEEEILFVKTTDYHNAVYPIEKVIQDWTDEENGTIVKCERSEVII